jgi:hypothetical protein
MADDYKVGYRKPPRHTQFRKGQSGNPNGRPKGTKNLKTDLLEELAERIPIRERGRPRHITKQRAVIKGVVAATLQGKDAARGHLLTLMTRVLPPDAENDSSHSDLSPEEQEILRAVVARTKPSDKS